ncbi:MAG: NAD(+)/NADH kinase [Tepidisphaeraceae bacterium]
MRVFVVANAEKPNVRPALDELLPWLAKKVTVVGTDTSLTDDLRNVQADAMLILGGDGTLLSAARRLGGRQIPLMGVNFGRLGFLASFTPEQFRDHFDSLIAGKLPISTRQVLEASVLPAGIKCDANDCADVEAKRRFSATALNDAVVTAGAPFHMIELELRADGDSGVRYFGDGVIVATPSGSTAYNVSAGGPIIDPSVDAICITPICPHSLSFRPVVVSSRMTVVITASRVNPGTTLFCDGQASTKLSHGETVVLRRSPNDVLLVENPQARQWRSLAEKLHWAASPRHSSPG